MSFVWIPTPQVPEQEVSTPIGPEEVSYKVHAVANTVDWGGTVRYNTANTSYDVVYEFDTMNVDMMFIDNAFFDTATINTLNANIVTSNTVTMNTGNIANLYASYGIITGNATSNLSVVTKEYADNAIQAISGGSGFDTTANLFLAKGDLLVGYAPNTAHRLPVGSNGQMLTVNSASDIRVSWEDPAVISQEAFNLHIGSHHHPYRKDTTVLLRKADAIVMDTGDHVSGWSNLTANLLSSGVGGLDSNSVLAANTWYAVYAIYNPTSDSRGLLLHRMTDRTIDQQWVPVPADAQINYLRRSDTAITAPLQRYCTLVSQSFIPSMTAPLRAVNLRVSSVTTTNPGNCWITIRHDDGLGNPQGTILATSRSLNGGECFGTSTQHFIFDTALTLTAGTRYHIVAEGDYPINTALTTDANSFGFYGNTAPLTDANQRIWMDSVGYNADPGNILVGFGSCRMFNTVTQLWTTAANTGGSGAGAADLFFQTYMETNNTSVVLPSGYTQKAVISYVCTNTNSRLKYYEQVGKMAIAGYNLDWRAWTSNTTPSGVSFVDLRHAVPPVECYIQFNTQQSTTGVETTGNFGPILTYASLFSNRISTRGYYRAGTRSSQLYHTFPILFSDAQGMMAYQNDTTTTMFVITLRF